MYTKFVCTEEEESEFIVRLGVTLIMCVVGLLKTKDERLPQDSNLRRNFPEDYMIYFKSAALTTRPDSRERAAEEVIYRNKKIQILLHNPTKAQLICNSSHEYTLYPAVIQSCYCSYKII